MLAYQICTAKIQYRKFETNIPRKGIARPQSQFPQLCVCERFIYFQESACLFRCRKTCIPIVGIYKSLTDTLTGKQRLRPRNPFSGNICFEFSVLYLCSAYLIGQREQTKHIATKTYHPKPYRDSSSKLISSDPNINETNTSPTLILMKPTLAVCTVC
jgi:hypothetical protein